MNTIRPDTTGKKSRTSLKGKAKRQKILDIAMEMFARGGYSGTAIAAVAEKADLTLPGLLHYFPNKTALLLAVLAEQDGARFEAFAPGMKTWRSALETTRAVVKQNVARAKLVQAFAILNAESLTDNYPAVSFFRNRWALAQTLVTPLFQAGIDAGEIRTSVVPKLIVTEIIAFLDGLQVLWLRDPEHIDMVASFDDYVHRLTRSIEV